MYNDKHYLFKYHVMNENSITFIISIYNIYYINCKIDKSEKEKIMEYYHKNFHN
jgi:hypothetical protein